MHTKTAILIFARSAQADAAHKRLRNGVSVFKELNARIENSVIQTGLPYFVYTEEQQRGTDFATRFTNALQDIYNLGFEKVISVGNDTPQLTKKHLLAAVNKLETCPLVLGPSQDGGFYLMGLSKEHFDRDAFLNLPWQTASLTRSIIRLVQARKIHAELLPALYDIDSSADIGFILSHAKELSETLRNLLIKAFRQKASGTCLEIPALESAYQSIYYNKGSPICSLLN